jgi:hypothetical protein
MDWLTPTLRLVRWVPLVVACALALMTIVLVRALEQPLRTTELTVCLAMIVIGALCGLHDPAREFVHAVPVPASRRLTHRLLLIVPALALTVMLVRLATEVLFTVLPPLPGWTALTAFGAVGVALCTALARRIGARAVDAAVSGMVGWLAVAIAADPLGLSPASAMPWWRWPEAVMSLAALGTVIGSTRGVEA